MCCHWVAHVGGWLSGHVTTEKTQQKMATNICHIK